MLKEVSGVCKHGCGCSATNINNPEKEVSIWLIAWKNGFLDRYKDAKQF